jgi:hypothetical protein
MTGIPAHRRVSARPILEALELRSLLSITNPNNGPVIESVQAESVFYGQAWASSSMGSQVDDINGFLGDVTDSTFMDMLNVYGVGRGTFSAGPNRWFTNLPSGPTISDDQI